MANPFDIAVFAKSIGTKNSGGRTNTKTHLTCSIESFVFNGIHFFIGRIPTPNKALTIPALFVRDTRANGYRPKCR